MSTKQQQAMAKPSQTSLNKQQNLVPKSSQAPLTKQQQSLDKLQSMINGVLIETGKALRSANRQGSMTTGHTQTRLQVILPYVIDKFHLALDDLESDIVGAKAVLSRDLRELQAKQHQIHNPVTESAETSDDLDGALAETAMHLPRATDAAASTPSQDIQETANGKEPEIDSLAITLGRSPHEKAGASSVNLSPTLDAMDGVETKDPETDVATTGGVEGQGKDSLPNVSIHPSLGSPEGLGTEIANDAALNTSDASPIADDIGAFDSFFDDNNNVDSDLNLGTYDYTDGNTGNQNDGFRGANEGFDLNSFGSQSYNGNGDSNAVLPDMNSCDDANGGSLNAMDPPNNNVGDANAAMGDPETDGGDIDMALNPANESNFEDMFSHIDFETGDIGTGEEFMEHGVYDTTYFDDDNSG